MDMKWTMSTRRRADEFAAVVDGVRAPDDVSAETREFFAIVAGLRDVETPSMRADFAADLRERLMAAAPTALAELAPPIRAREASGKETRLVDDSWRARSLQVATTTLLVCATAGGVAAASQSALPGDPLYQVKRGLEWVQVVTAGSDQDRGDVLLNQASERLAEAERLAISRPDDPRTSSLISSTLDDFEQQATDGSNALVDDYRADGDPASIVEVREFADDSSTQLDDLGRLVPPDVQRDVVDAAGVLTNIDGRARDACETCSALEPLQLSSGLSQLAATTQGVLDVLPGELGSATGGDGGQQPPVQLPTLPVLTGSPGDGDPTHQEGQAPGGGHQTTGGNGGQGGPQLPLPTGGGVTTPPSIPLPSVPGIPLPTSVPLPSRPLPSLPLPTILPLP
jgi:hypothetical protein